MDAAGAEARFPPPDPRPHDRVWPDAVWPPDPSTVLRGDHVELRPTVPGDAGGLHAALDDPRAWEHLPTPRPSSADGMRALVEEARATRFPWTVRTRHDGAVVGWTSFLDTSVHDARTEIGSTQYAPAVWGGVVNPETKLLLLGLAFDRLGMGRVQLKTDVRNVRSQQALARLGATFEGVLRRYQRRADGTVRDTVMFSVVAEDWPPVRDGLRRRLAAHQDPTDRTDERTPPT